MKPFYQTIIILSSGRISLTNGAAKITRRIVAAADFSVARFVSPTSASVTECGRIELIP